MSRSDHGFGESERKSADVLYCLRNGSKKRRQILHRVRSRNCPVDFGNGPAASSGRVWSPVKPSIPGGVEHPSRARAALSTVDGLAANSAFRILGLVVHRYRFINTKSFGSRALDGSVFLSRDGWIDFHSWTCSVSVVDFPIAEMEKYAVLRMCRSDGVPGGTKHHAPFSNRPVAGSIGKRGDSVCIAPKGRSERLEGNDQSRCRRRRGPMALKSGVRQRHT